MEEQICNQDLAKLQWDQVMELETRLMKLEAENFDLQDRLKNNRSPEFPWERLQELKEKVAYLEALKTYHVGRINELLSIANGTYDWEHCITPPKGVVFPRNK